MVTTCNSQEVTKKSTTLSTIQKSDIKKLQQEDTVISTFLDTMASNAKLPSYKIKHLTKGVRKLYNSWKHMKLDEDGVLYRVVHQNGNEVRQFMLPSICDAAQVWGGPRATEHTKECLLPRRPGC